MPKKADAEKLTGRLLLPLGAELEGALREVAAANNTSPQDLLREAVHGIIRYQRANGFVSRPMDIVPHDHHPVPSREVLYLLDLVREKFRTDSTSLNESAGQARAEVAKAAAAAAKKSPDGRSRTRVGVS